MDYIVDVGNTEKERGKGAAAVVLWRTIGTIDIAAQ